MKTNKWETDLKNITKDNDGILDVILDGNSKMLENIFLN